jgi:hypothetical protein
MQQFFGWTEEKVKYLKDHGHIRGYTEVKKKNSHKKRINIPQRSEEKDWLSWNLPFWCNEHSVTLETEYAFHPARKWKFDWAIPALKIAVEYEGIFKKDKSVTGHNSIGGVMRDIEKYNQAQLLGWRVIRVTANNYRTVHEQLNSYVA